MWKLLQNIANEDEQDLYLGTNDIFRPDLKQIGNSLFEIRSYYIKKDSYSIAPNHLSTPLAKVKERLIEHIESHACDFRFDPLTNDIVDFPNPKAGPCFMFVSHSLSVALDFCTSPRPSNTICDVFLALPTQSVIVLSLIDGDEDSPEAVAYSISVARGVTETLSRFTDEDINSIHGVIHKSLTGDIVGFKNRLKKLAKESSHFVTNDSLVMTPSRYEKVLTAFWAGVAETKSVLKEETRDTDGDRLRFLTKEQCIILVENINSMNVEVKCVPGSGATTLMLEVARRLNRLGDTLLVCRSRQERDRLRSVYPSTVAAEDLSMVDLSSGVNLVDETNTVVGHTSGQHWQFTSYQAEVKERMSQIMEAKLQNISKQEEQDLYLGTNDIFRPDLKQIGDSVFEIRSYFVEKDGLSIAPKQLSTPLAKVKERLIEHIESHACDFRFDPLTFEVVDFPNPKAGPCFMFISHSLSVALDFYTSPRPSSTICDVFLALPTQSVTVLSLADGDEDSPEVVAYSMSVARGVIETLSSFTDEDINSIHGVIHTSLLDDTVGFKNRLKTLANESSHFVTKDSLGMTPSRYEKVLTAFWAGVAQTKSVLKEETGDTDGDCLRFLTKEQCIILVENINSKNVEVKCVPGSGATTLMLEVARRLNRLGDTLLVCRSRQERDRLRSAYPSAVAAEDLTTMDMPSCVNIVDETNTVVAHTSGQHWQFTSYQAEVKERMSQIMEAKLQNISKQEEQDLYLGTNDIFRPDLKQIGDSVFEIRSYFVEKDGQSIAPKQLSTPLAKVKERLIEHIESHACDFRFDPLTFEVVDFPYPKAGPCFMFISHSLSVALDFYTSPRPSSTVCDVFLALPTQSVIVLSLADGDEDFPEAVAYSMSVAKGVIETLSSFTDEDINSIHGVIHTSLLDDTVGFKNRLKTLANESSHFVTMDSLGMTPSRYEKVLTAFWAGVAQTKSVLKEETGDTDGDCLRFLTKEQCIILVENINSKNVEVKCVPGSGATTLMLEVARRLNRLGDTLLVCRSRQERDRLRSAYPSAVAAEDLTTMDMPSCVNIVDETNTVVAHTSGQHWQFTSYQAEVKERMSQIMEAKLQNISKQEEQDLYLGTNDIFRPDLKQIGDSVFEIRSYFVEKDGQNIAPKQLSTPLAKVKERLIEHIESHACDFRFDPLTFEVVDFPFPKAGPCFMFISHSLSVALDFYTSPRPSSTICDVFLALPTQSVIVLSLVDGDEDSPEAVAYSMSVARGVIETLSRFTDEDINSIHGVIHTSLLDDTLGFKNRLKTLANESSHFVTKNSLGMTPSRYEKVLTAFWAGVAQTKSVLKEETGDTDGDCLRFLTKEQCIILVENINSKNVEVKCVPGSGATTLMLEVARRLNRLGDTLLVCRSRQERDKLSSAYPSAVAAEDLTTMDMPSCVNIVDETNTVVAQTSGQHWQFTSYQAEVKERTSQIMEAKLQNISKQEEQDLYLGTNDIFRPDLKQIGDTRLVCRSRQERDKLRSVYPSAVAAEDLTTMDMPSCVNIVDETNTVVAQTSGEHWQFTSYQAEVKERMPQIMEAKLQNISKQDDQDLYLGTNDIFRPDLKQIGNSVFEIRSYFVEKDDQSIAPTTLSTPLAKVKERIIEHIDSHAYDFTFDPLTNEVVDFPNQKGGPYFMFVSHSLSVALDFYTSPRPSNTVCDVLLALPTQSVIVLSLIDGDEDSPEAVAYSMSVARGVIETLSRFTDEDINSIHGVIHTSLLDDTVGFKNRLKTLANESSHFVTNDSLGMTPSRYEKVLTAFWAGVAETKSVLKEETGDTDGDCLRFLTKEQCIILVENINSKNVEVKCVPGSGATTLMLELARRLNRLGDTLLVCRSRQERDRLRSVYPSVIAAEDLSMVDMSSCVNIVDETNTVVTQTSGQHWQFKTYLTDIKELKNQIFEADMEIEGMEKQIDVLSNESWMERIEYLLRDFSLLKMFSFKLGSTEPMSAHGVRHKEYKPGPLRTSKDQNAALGGLKHMSATGALWLSDLQDRLRQRENIVPLFRSVIIQDTTHQIYQGVKNVFLRKALGTKKHAEPKQSLAIVGHVESPDIQQQMEMFHIEPENARKESDIPTVRKEGGQVNIMETMVQDTDGKDLESRWDEIKTLNAELDNLLKDRACRNGQLHKLYTVELQAAVEYLARHKGDLSMLDIEIPGLQVFQGGQDRHEPTFPGRVTSVQGTSAVSTVGHEEIGEEVGPSKRKRRRLDISGSATSLLQSHDRNIGRDEGQRLTRAPGLISQLRQYQQGRLTEKHLCAITMKIIRDDELQLKELMANNDCLEKEYGSTVHVVGLTRRPLLVSCPKLHLDSARANTEWCHVTPGGELVNRRPDTRDEGKYRLQEYRGTCGSPIPLPPPSSTLTPLPYWETETRVRLGGWQWLVLEMGVCEAGQVDSWRFVSRQRRSWCISVESCGRHEGGICTRAWREGEEGECHPDTMSHTPDTQYTLHYGIVLDVGRGRVAFTDLDRQVVLDKFNVEFREPLVPMFSVGEPYPVHTTSMRLISGEDINMTDTKKALIYQALK